MPGAPVRRPELSELEALVTAIATGSIGAAARRLGVSQPALSKRIRQLEALCQTTLVERSPRGVSATPAGSQLATASLRILHDVGELDALLAELRGRNAPVRIASSPVVVETLLPELLGASREALAGLPIEITAANSAVVRRLVETGGADLGIAASDGAGPADGAPVISEDEVIVALPPGHPWVNSAVLTAADLVSTPLVLRDPRSHARTMLDAALRERGLSLMGPAVELGSTRAAVTAALQTNTPAVLSRLALGDDDRLVVRRLDDVTLRRRFVMLTADRAQRSASALRVRAALLAAAG